MTDIPDYRYWIAINGSGCALSITPMVDAETTPVAEQMFGFPTLEEAQKAQRICLKAPIPEVEAFMESLRPDVASGRIVYKRPDNPGPQTCGRTVWSDVGAQGSIPDWVKDQASEMAEHLDRVSPLPGLPGGPKIH